MPPFEQEVLPIQLPMQPLNISRRRASRMIPRSDASLASASIAVGSTHGLGGLGGALDGETHSKAAGDSVSFTIQHNPHPSTMAGGPSGSSSSNTTTAGTGTIPASDNVYTSPLAWLSRVITKAGQDERLHYHPNGQHHHSHYHNHSRSHSHHHSHSHHPHSHSSEKGLLNGHHGSTVPMTKQLFSKATVVTLEKKYATVHWAAEFYCTISSPCFALPLMLYLDPSFRWSAPEVHTIHFAVFLSVLTALTSTLYHATLYKIFSSLDACFATIMFYINTIHLLRSLPDPYAMMVPEPISTVVHWNGTPYLLASGMMALFIFSWKRTAMLSLSLMVLMIPASIWGFVAHESWAGLAFGLVGLAMFAADRFKIFCGHSYWHLAGGLSLWYGIASGALAK